MSGRGCFALAERQASFNSSSCCLAHWITKRRFGRGKLPAIISSVSMSTNHLPLSVEGMKVWDFGILFSVVHTDSDPMEP